MNPRWKAIAAMAQNRVIGKGGMLPWHLPEDFRWFKRKTLGHALIMGRKTFESLGRPLPGRRNLVLTRGGAIPGAETVQDLAALLRFQIDSDLFVIGGAEVFRQLLPACGELFLSVVAGDYEGDVFFPEFESWFSPGELLENHDGFKIFRHVNLDHSRGD